MFMQVLELKSLINNINFLFKHLTDKKNLDLIVNTDENIPDFIVSDQQRIEQIIKNLISNAIKFSYENSVIKIISKLEGDKLKISIIDTGLGIVQKNVAKMFEISESISTHGTAGEKGTGIGLPLSKEFVEKNNISVY